MTALVTADEAQALLEGTTPGPWATYERWSDPPEWGVCTNGVGARGLPTIIARHMTPADAALCGQAPDLARTVVAQAEELAAQAEDLVRLRDVADFWQRQHGVAVDVRDGDIAAWKGESARLREALDTLRAAVVAERDARCDSDDADEAAREAVNYDDEAEMVDAADVAAERWHKALATLNALLGPTTGGDR